MLKTLSSNCLWYHWFKKPIVGEYKRARMVWSTEFGKKKDRPHFNILLEDFVYPFNAQQSLEVLLILCYLNLHDVFGGILPIFNLFINPTKDNLIRYICKESNWKNTTLDYQLSDL